MYDNNSSLRFVPIGFMFIAAPFAFAMWQQGNYTNAAISLAVLLLALIPIPNVFRRRRMAA